MNSKSTAPTSNTTELLRAWRGGDGEAVEQLIPILESDLRQIASRLMAGERPNHTLQPTALVGEAYLKLMDADVDWQDRAHFFAVAATAMRRILIDHARSRRAQKRDGGVQVTLSNTPAPNPSETLDVLDLHSALEALEARDAESARVLELQYFGGMTADEIAEVIGLSRATVERRARFGKAWLRNRLGPKQ